MINFKLQHTLEFAILLSASLFLITLTIAFFLGVFNNSGIVYLTAPIVFSKLEFSNFVVAQNGECFFDINYVVNQNHQNALPDLGFVLNNGLKIEPNYNNYTESIHALSNGSYSYTFIQKSQSNYNSTICTTMAHSLNANYFVKYVFYRNSNNKIVFQPVSGEYSFIVNTPSQTISSSYQNNTVSIDSDIITNAGIVNIYYQNGTAVKGNPFTFGEYVYLPTGNYKLSYSNESDPVTFKYWQFSGGVISTGSIFSNTTNVTLINGGEIYVVLRNPFLPIYNFAIYANKTIDSEGSKIDIYTNYSNQGYYTYFVNNAIYNNCQNTQNESCIIQFNTAGTYQIFAKFINLTEDAISETIPITIYAPLSAQLESNTTIATQGGNVLLTASASGGLSPYTYTFYANNQPIQGCISTPNVDCKFTLASNQNYTVYASVSDSNGDIAKTNQIIISPEYITIFIDNTQSVATTSPLIIPINLNATKNSQYEASDLGNLRFYEGSTELYSWCQSNCSSTSTNATFWVRIPQALSPNQQIELKLYYASPSTNYDGVYAGENEYYGGQSLDNIQKVMLPGLGVMFYENLSNESGYYYPSGCNHGGPGQHQESGMFHYIQIAGMYYGYIIPPISGTTACPNGFENQTNFFNTSGEGSTERVYLTTEPYVVINYGYGSSSPDIYPYPFPYLENQNQFYMKVIGFAKVNSGTAFSGYFAGCDRSDSGDDSMSILGYNITGGNNYQNWIESNITTGPSSLFDLGYDSNCDPSAIMSSPTITAQGDYRLEMISYVPVSNARDEPVDLGKYVSLWSNNQVYYFHPSYYPNGIEPSVSINYAIK